MRSPRGSPSSRDAYSSPISSPTAATTTAPTSSRSPRSAYRHCFSQPARTSSAGWGRTQIEEWELKKYHQPADKLDGSWNFDGMIQDAQLDMLSAWLITQADGMPTWKPGDEFEAARKQALGALAGQ